MQMEHYHDNRLYVSASKGFFWGWCNKISACAVYTFNAEGPLSALQCKEELLPDGAKNFFINLSNFRGPRILGEKELYLYVVNI